MGQERNAEISKSRRHVLGKGWRHVISIRFGAKQDLGADVHDGVGANLEGDREGGEARGENPDELHGHIKSVSCCIPL
jgi:hypothetical protein